MRLAALIGLSAAGSASGNYIVVRLDRTVPGSVIAPLIYTQLISAALAGVPVFGDRPGPIALAGLTVILVPGLAALALVRPAS